jgi:hypothetical protein
VNGFARGLAARARGGPDGAGLRARRAPRSLPATGAAPAREAAVEVPTAREERRARADDVRAAPVAAPAPSPAGSGQGRAPYGQQRLREAGPRERDAAAAPPSTPAPARAAAPVDAKRAASATAAGAAAPAASVPPAATVARAEMVVRADAIAAPEPAATRTAPRPAATPPAASPVSLRTAARPVTTLPATSAAAPEAPRIEVHIGRVEVSEPRRTPAPRPPQPPRRAPSAQGRHGAAAQPAGSAFAELAAVRRHVDRLAR